MALLEKITNKLFKYGKPHFHSGEYIDIGEETCLKVQHGFTPGESIYRKDGSKYFGGPHKKISDITECCGKHYLISKAGLFYVYNLEGELAFGSPWFGIVPHVNLEEVNCEPYVNFGTTYLHGVASASLFPSGYFSEDGTPYDNKKEIELFRPLQYHLDDEELYARVRQVYNSMMSFIVNPPIVDKKSIKAAAAHSEEKSRLADVWAEAVWKVVREHKEEKSVMKDKLGDMCRTIERYIIDKPDFFMDSVVELLEINH